MLQLDIIEYRTLMAGILAQASKLAGWLSALSFVWLPQWRVGEGHGLTALTT